MALVYASARLKLAALFGRIRRTYA